MSSSHAKSGGPDAAGGEPGATVWILVDRSDRRPAFESVAQHLDAADINTQIVTITDVIGSVARDALAGGAERLLRGLRVAFKGGQSDEDLLGAVRRARPDVLAVTNPRYGRALSLLDSIAGINPLQVGVLADYQLTADWMSSSLQAFIVPTDTHRQRLVSNGFLGERVLVAPPPVRPGFSDAVDADQARQSFGFGADQQVVLVRADGFAGPLLQKLVFQATLVDGDVRFIFHHNGDGGCAAALRRAADQYGLPAAMFGAVDDLARFVAASDLVVAHDRDSYLAEILAQGRPLVLVSAGKSHRAGAEFLAQQGAAHHVGDVLRLGRELERALEAQPLADATQAAAQIGAADGSKQMADALAVAVDHADRWQDGAGPNRASDDNDTDGDQPDAVSSGPFESIGAGATNSDSAADGSQTPGSTAAQQTRHSRQYAGISTAEAKDQLAELILVERQLQRDLTEAQRQQNRWRNRLDLARQWNEEDLADDAEDILRGHLSDATNLEEDLDDVRRQKAKLKRAAGADGQTSGAGRALPPATESANQRDVERRFQHMELDRDLDDLKDKIDRDLGD